MIDLEVLNKNMEILGLTLEEDISGRNIGTKDKMKFKDKDGYLYSLSSGNICHSININSNLSKFFKGNPYTCDNIKLYLIINNINLELISNDIKTAKEKLVWKCKIHNTLFNRDWNAISNGNLLCPDCRRHSYSYDEVKQYIEVDSKSGCKLLSKSYKDNHANLHLKCTCGNEFYRAFCIFKGTTKRDGVHKCKKCTGATERFDYEFIKNDLFNNGIKLFSTEYKNQNEKLDIEYSCGFKTKRNYANIIKSKYKCPHCIKKGYGRDTIQLNKEIDNISNGEYKLLSEYKTMNHKVTIIHNKCGHIYEVTPHNFLDGGNRCPKCASSKAEILIENYFKSNKIKYISQYEYEDLVGLGGLPLKFDFAIFDNNDNLLFQLEYDGEFHYLPINGQLALEKQQEHDRRKDEYCKSNNIDLLRIPYWEFDNIEEILNEKLIKELI